MNALGVDTAHNVTVKDFIPNGVTLVNLGGGTLNTGVLSWNSPITLAPGASMSYVYTATVLAPNTTNSYKNTAQVSGHTEHDRDSYKNNLGILDTRELEDDEASVTLLPRVIDVSLTKTVSNIKPNVGEVVTYTVTVMNALGVDTAHNVTVKDFIPNGVTPVNLGGGSLAAGVLSWNS